MVDFVLDDLGCPAGEGFDAGLEIPGLIAHIDLLTPPAAPGAAQ